ncbi:FAD/NAD(P)-binding protein [Zhihengliuella halotolerans]|uniref:FAD/NAD(P)-binding protein n=1 Tax=Zhihengliuella halotolerans TaxID=370736 RepID=UPI002155268B|nr:FAD/NAD(P)-binding protein [Zhihengliuella halotolerans]
MSRERYVVTVIGAGPRGTSVLERLLARLEADRRDRELSPHDGEPRAEGSAASTPARLAIQIVEPYRPGSGHVWSSAQSRLFLMNTPAMYPTVAPPREGDGPGLTFEQWRGLGGDGAVLAPVEQRELADLGPGDYPSRALYGRYLEHVHDAVVARLSAHPDVESVEHLRASSVGIERRSADYRIELTAHDDAVRTSRGRIAPTAGLSDRRPGAAGVDSHVPEAVASDAVVLAVGHVPAELNPRQAAAGRRAEELGLTYQGPNVPSDVDWAAFPGGEPLLVRGLGLNFFDALAQLTTARGGDFVPTGAGPGRALDYRRSGREPKIFAASRRGAPYRAKAEVPAFVPPSVELVYLTFERVHALAAAGAPGEPRGKVGFDAHIWPLLHRDVLRTYYRVAARVAPERFRDVDEFLARLDVLLDAQIHPEQNVQGTPVHGQEVWRSQVADLVDDMAPEVGWLDVPALGAPFAKRGFTSADAYQQAVLEYLEADAAGSAAGEDDPLKMAIGALHAGRLLTKRLVAESLIDEVSRTDEVQKWFEPLVEGAASGPPLRRIEELAALARAGVVTFLGPDPVFTLDDEGEYSGVFTASSRWVDAPPVTAHHMLEAMMPANRVAQTASPLLKRLQSDGLARPIPIPTEDGETVPGPGFDVVGTPYRLVDASGIAHRSIFVLGLQLSGVQWGTAIAAEAGGSYDDGARTLADADAVAVELLRLAR